MGQSSHRKAKSTICCIDRFTSVCKNLFNLLGFLAKAFRCHVHHFQCLTLHRKASAKNSSKLSKFLQSEVNLSIQHIMVQDQDGQNSNTKYRKSINIETYRSRNWLIWDILVHTKSFCSIKRSLFALR